MLTTESQASLAKRKATGAHFTPPELARLVSRRLVEKLGPQPGMSIRILDPACGEGELLLALADSLPLPLRQRSVFIGVESDPDYLARAKSRFAEMSATSYFMHGDFLAIAQSMRETPLLRGSLPAELVGAPIDVIIANPPYVRTQVLGAGRAQDLAEVFGLTGRVDLYHAFFVAMTDLLSPGGLLGVITSNRYLTTRGGASVRSFLANEYEVLEVLDLGDTKLFDAAVLPAVFFGRKKEISAEGQIEPPTFVRIYEEAAASRSVSAAVSALPSVIDILSRPSTGCYESHGIRYSVTTGRLSIPSPSSEPWSMTTERESDWVAGVDTRMDCRIRDVAKVRVGIKSTADPVFIRSDWDRLPEELQPEPQLLRHLLSHDDAQRWRYANPGGPSRRILYTHEVRHGKRLAIDLPHFPRAERYLTSHRKRLEGRHYVASAGRQWYEIWVPQDPEAWGQPKVVFPDISPTPKFFYDAEGCLVDGNCYWITLSPGVAPDVLHLILGVANSEFATQYYDLAFQNKLYSGRRRYLTQYVERFPLPALSSPFAKRIVELAKTLSDPTVPLESVGDLESEIDRTVALAFGVQLEGRVMDQKQPSRRARQKKTSVSTAVI